MFTKTFLKDLVERVVASFAGALVSAGALLPGGYFESKNIQLALGAALFSFLKALAATRAGDQESASLVK